MLENSASQESGVTVALLIALGISLGFHVMTVWAISKSHCQLVNPLPDLPPIDLGDALMDPAVPPLIFPTPPSIRLEK